MGPLAPAPKMHGFIARATAMLRPTFAILTTAIALAVVAPAHARKIADIARLKNQRTNTLTGLGLVVGLPGTGDGGDFMPAIKPLAAMLAKYADPTTVRELADVKNVALVSVTATIPPVGALKGDELDVHVMSLGGASSLAGGRLFVTPLVGPLAGNDVFALASGKITIEDPKSATHAIVKAGAVMEEDVKAEVIENGRITLIIHEASASWTVASTIAKIINDAEGTGETLAIASSDKTVEVLIPASEKNPDSFISRVQRLPVPILPDEARVVINEKTGTIIMTGDVEISPTVISHKGLTITTVNPAPRPSERAPIVTEKQAISLDTTSQGGAKLQELVDALDLIKVPAADRIAIIRQLHATGKLHAKLIEK